MSGDLQVRLFDSFIPSNLATLAKGNLAYRYALHELNPFAVLGVDYEAHNADGELDLFNPKTGEGELTEQYLADRSLFAVLNSQTLQSLIGRAIASINYFEDRTTGRYLGSPIPLPVVGLPGGAPIRQFIFGNDHSEALTGGEIADHLYGGNGDDDLTGDNGNDYLEGGNGNDSLVGGLGNDTLLGGKGYDTYFLTVGEGVDRLLDHGNDQLQIDGAVVSGDFKPAFDVGYVYYSGDKTYELRQLSTSDVWRLSVLDPDTKEYQAVADLDHWQSGDFNITKSAATTGEHIDLDLTGSPAFLNFNGST